MGGVVNNPVKGNGFVILETDPSITVWQAKIIKREYSENSFVDIAVHQESFSGTNSYFIPTRYWEDKSTHEFFYHIKGLDVNNNVVYDTGIHSAVGDGTPSILLKTWVCDGFDYAYALELWARNGVTDGRLILKSAKYMYEYIRPQDMPNESWPEWNWEYFRICHGLGVGWLSEIPTTWNVPNAYNPSIFRIQNTEIGAAYYDRYGYLITTDMLYAVQKANWKWGSSQVYVEGIDNAEDLQMVDMHYIVDYMNENSNIAQVCPDWPELDCTSSSSPGYVEYMGSASNGIMDCMLSAIQASNGQVADVTDYSYAGDGDVITFADIVSDCFETTDFSSLNGFEIVDVTDHKKPNVAVSFTSEDLTDQNGQFTIPSFTLNKGTYCVSATFSNGKHFHFFTEVAKRTLNILEDAQLVNITIAPVPIIGDEYTVTVSSQINSTSIYEVLDHKGQIIYTSKVKLGANQSFRFPVEITEGIPIGNVFHRFTFEDGSTKTINTLR